MIAVVMLTKVLDNEVHSVHEVRQKELANMEIQEFFAAYLEHKQVVAFAKEVGLMLVREDAMTIAPAWPYRLKITGARVQQRKQFELTIHIEDEGLRASCGA
jgi:hypothetical protein